MEIDWDKMVKVMFIDTPAERRIQAERLRTEELDLTDPYWEE